MDAFSSRLLIPLAVLVFLVGCANIVVDQRGNGALVLPPAVTAVTATAGTGQVTLGWKVSTGAASYNLYWSTSNGLTVTNGTKITGVSSGYVHAGLNNGTTYYYLVTAVNSDGESGPSGLVSATPQVPLSGAPTGLAATSAPGQTTLTWTPVTGAVSYNLYWSTSSTLTTASGTPIPGVSSGYVHTGLNNGTAYYYLVTAVNPAGESAASALATATPQVAIPQAPAGISAMSAAGQNTLSWNSVSNAASYNLYWSTSAGVTPANGTKIVGATSGYVHTGLNNGTSYHYVVTAVNAAGESGPSSTVSGLPQVSPAGAPSGLSAVAASQQSTVTWTSVLGAASYNLYWSTSSSVSPSNGTKIAGAASGYMHTGLANGTTYYYVVTAVNGGGESAPSNSASATPQVAAPSAPTGLTVSGGNGQTTVSWNSVTGATGYNLYWSTSSGITSSTGTKVSGAVSGQSYSGLNNGTTYYYMVTAVNDGGESSASNQGNATPQVPAPAVPTGLTVSGGNGQTTVSWNSVSEATSYNLYWSTTTGVTSSNGTKVSGAVSGQAYSGLNNGTTYYYVVTAVNAGGESSVSNQASATPQVPAPSAPTGLSVTAASGQTTVTWNVVTGAASYNLYWSTTTGVTISNGTKITGATRGQVLTGLVNGTTYYYVVTAVNAGGESSASGQASATPQVAAPSTPTGLTVTAGSGQTTVSWNSVVGATSYNLYWSTSSSVTKATGTKITGAVSGFSHTGLTNGTSYYYLVTAVNPGGESAASAVVMATPILQLAQWAATHATNISVYFNGVAADASSNTYAVGTIAASGTCDFGNGVSAVGVANGSAVVVKYDATGKPLWARATTMTGGKSAVYYGATADSSGNIIVVGILLDTGTYGFGNSVTATRSDGWGPVVVKYDSSGNALWAATSTSTTTRTQWSSVATNSLGELYCAGFLAGAGTEDFGNSVTATGVSGQYLPIVVKYSASGVAQAVQTITSGTGFMQSFQSVAVGSDGKVCAVGYINGTNATQTGRGFLAQFAGSLGSPLWTKLLDSPSVHNQLLGVSVDSTGQIYAAGFYSGAAEIDLDNSVKVTGSSTGTNPILIKLNSSGTTLWASTLTAGQGYSMFTGVDLDSSGLPYVSGNFNGSGTQGFGNGVILSSLFSGNNPVVVKYDASGAAQWAQSSFVAPGVTSGDNNNFFGIAVDSQDYPVAVGYIQRTIGFSKTLVVTGANGSYSPIVVRYLPQ